MADKTSTKKDHEEKPSYLVTGRRVREGGEVMQVWSIGGHRPTYIMDVLEIQALIYVKRLRDFCYLLPGSGDVSFH